MVFGVGTDCIEVDRIRRLVSRGDAMLNGVFTASECTYCRSKRFPDRHFAARFAAKEAFMKALGTGWRDGIRFADIEIGHDPLGKPEIALSGKARDMLEQRATGFYRVHVSLSHVKSMATATVIIETGE
ncbi:holo-ACP synthase [bacterium]|nr:holo-ACP synthase [candidate division CSSED10-310 bacterium]